jgi:Mg/Co/Ni transporter MgtE
MSVEELEKAITKLSSKERTRLLRLLEEMDAAEVDANLERDIKAGKFDQLAEQALADHKAGKTKPL